VEYFRNDHIIELNPNIIMGTIKIDEKYANPLGIDVEIDVLINLHRLKTMRC
jgi:hypothetical protein